MGSFRPREAREGPLSSPPLIRGSLWDDHISGLPGSLQGTPLVQTNYHSARFGLQGDLSDSS